MKYILLSLFSISLITASLPITPSYACGRDKTCSKKCQEGKKKDCDCKSCDEKDSSCKHKDECPRKDKNQSSQNLKK